MAGNPKGSKWHNVPDALRKKTRAPWKISNEVIDDVRAFCEEESKIAGPWVEDVIRAALAAARKARR